MSNDRTVSTKPYLLRAIWEWCVDQGFTPYLACLVDAGTRVPPGYARDGQIVLNLSPDATGQLQMDNEYVSFQARFGGVAHSIVVPVGNVIAIYARENGQGMAFEPDLPEDETQPEAQAVPEDMAEVTAALQTGRPEDEAGADRSKNDREGSAEEDEGHVPPPARRGSHLKLVK